MSDVANGGDSSTPEVTKAAEAAAEGSLPIFYTKPEVLSAEQHGGLELKSGNSFTFAKDTNAIPLNVAEFPLAARSYPIVFVGTETVTPLAIVGLRNAQNLFIDDSGAWIEGHYVPSYVRRYPFVFVRGGDGTQYALCIDRASERVAEGTENPFFADGEMSELTKNALQFCTTFQQQHAATEMIVKKLVELDLLTTNNGTFTLKSGEVLAMNDFKIIDEAKLNALPDDVFLSLRANGVLAAIYCHLVSLNSWQNLALIAS